MLFVPKYRKKIDPTLLRNTMRSVAVQVTDKFVFSAVEGNYRAAEVKKALDMLAIVIARRYYLSK